MFHHCFHKGLPFRQLFLFSLGVRTFTVDVIVQLLTSEVWSIIHAISHLLLVICQVWEDVLTTLPLTWPRAGRRGLHFFLCRLFKVDGLSLEATLDCQESQQYCEADLRYD